MEKDSENNHIKWNINVEQERIFWISILIGIFIIIPNLCLIFQKGKASIINHEGVIYPISSKYVYYKGHRTFYLRNNFIFTSHKKAPASALYHIIEFWLPEDLNAETICKRLNEKYNIFNVDKRFIYKYLFHLKKIIAYYKSTIYNLETIFTENEKAYIAFDESLFTHVSLKQLWIVGLVNSTI